MRALKQHENKGKIDFTRLAQGIESRILNKDIIDPEAAKFTFGFESMVDDTDSLVAESAVSSVESELEQEVGVTEWNEELTQAQRDAGVITLAASGDPASYHAQATRSVIDNDVVLDASSADVTNISQESYDQRELEKLLPYSVAFNVGAARQTSAMEAIWPTIALTADQAGLNLSVTYNTVHHNFVHNSKGAATVQSFGAKKLIDALIDSSILKNDATEIVPIYDAGVGIFDTDYGPFNVQLDNETFQSGAIKFDTPFDLIAAGARSLVDPSSIRDMTDTIDHLVRLKTVNLKVTTADGTSYIPMNVLDLPYTQFQKSAEEHERRVQLTYSTNTLILVPDDKDKDGNPATALAPLRKAPFTNYVFNLKLTVNGLLNLEDGHGELNANKVSIDRIYKEVLKNGNKELIEVSDPAEIQAAKEKFTSIEAVSFVLKARYANLNRRERGIIVRTETRQQKYAIQLQPPITALKPVTDTASAHNVDAAITTARVGNSTAGVQELLNMRDILARYRSPTNRSLPATAIQGIGAWLVRPYFSYKELDMTKLVNNISGSKLAEDISASLILNIRDEFSKAMLISGYHAAEECSPAGQKEKVTAVICTDPRVMQYINIKGDTRLLGDQYNFMPVTSSYREFINEIYIVPRRESSVNSPDGLNWGNMFWLPELITNMPMARTGQISNEFIVQTRRRHICHCPIMIHLSIKNLDKVINEKVTLHVKNQ